MNEQTATRLHYILVDNGIYRRYLNTFVKMETNFKDTNLVNSTYRT